MMAEETVKGTPSIGHFLGHAKGCITRPMSSTHVIEAALASTSYNQVDSTANGHRIAGIGGAAPATLDRSELLCHHVA
jgi:hypothetical protein